MHAGQLARPAKPADDEPVPTAYSQQAEGPRGCPTSYLVVRLNYVIQLSDVRTDTRYAATSVDIIGAVSGRDFIVFLSHLGRPVPPALRSLDGGKAGALNVCVEGLAQRFRGEERNNEALASILELFLRHDWDSRHGLFQTELRTQATRRTCGSRAQGQDGSG